MDKQKFSQTMLLFLRTARCFPLLRCVFVAVLTLQSAARHSRTQISATSDEL